MILPWGTLLKAVAKPEIVSLDHVASLCLNDACIEIVLSYDRDRDVRQMAPVETGELDEKHMLTTLPRCYLDAGLKIVNSQRISGTDLMTYETTWAKRLAFGRPREVWRIQSLVVGKGRTMLL